MACYSRGSVRIYWPVLVWAFLLLLVFVQSWWAMFGLRTERDWTFGGFAIVLLQMTCLYMLAGLVLPDFPPDRAVDLRASYYANHRWFGIIAAFAGCTSLAKDLILSGHLPDNLNVAFHIIFITGAVAAAITRREWYHKTLVVVISLLFVLYIALLFTHLR